MALGGFDDRFVRELPGDPVLDPRPRQVHHAAWSRVAPTAVPAPRMVACADEVAELLGWTPEQVRSEPFVAMLGGNNVPDGSTPYAACYGGHQFGHWAGQLGDGRAITLGEVLGPAGRLEVQLKGAGPTPYSRGADGRAVLRSSVREFLCSEAMAHLGVPTTRALSLVTTGEGVVRDMLYDGHPRVEPGAVVCRVAPSFLRFGSYEIHAARGDVDTLGRLVDHTLAAHYPHLGTGRGAVVAWLAEVGVRSAKLVAEWMRVGFVHGVLNTDNLSILGITVDYGPYGWLEGYDPDWTPNTTDAANRRYRFANQPAVVGWNLSRLASALVPLVGEAEPLEEALREYSRAVGAALRETHARKLGLRELRPDDQDLLVELDAVLQLVETDFTTFWRGLGELSSEDDLGAIEPAFYRPPAPADRARIHRWVARWLQRASDDGVDPAERRARMRLANPRFVLRNWLAQLAIDRAEQGDPGGVLELLDAVRRPYDDVPGRDADAARRPEWARNRAGCSMLSCSS
ncbi:MAG: protein adenylyltransferase SelO [Myxococcota bacterium]